MVLCHNLLLFHCLQVPNEFIITMRKGKKVDNMRFSSEHRTDILSEALIFRHNFAEGIIDNLVCIKVTLHPYNLMRIIKGFWE